MPPLRPTAAAAPLRWWCLHRPSPALLLTSPSTTTTKNRSDFSPAASSAAAVPVPVLHHRALSTTPSLHRQKPSHLTVPLDQVPDYPYGPYQTYKQRNSSLYAGAKVRFGNVVAPKYHNKSRKKWSPNRHVKRLWSVSLQAFVRTRLTASVLSTIDRLGGIDEYLLGDKARRIKDLGPAGWKLRWKIMQTPAVRERFDRQRVALGLPPKGDLLLGATAAAANEGGLLGGLAGGDVTTASSSSSEAVLNEVDGMLARDEEFVLGGDEGGEEAIVDEVLVQEDGAQKAAATKGDAKV
ncbi:hypothetical protein F4778DRAFT_758875 [Xylariomycetidae sp. FL2044]|nr:hypothetical protein F4778DRAFT_758875 [Xylariomycetidae sp. FL2044]